MKCRRSTSELQRILVSLSTHNVGGIRRVAVKCLDMTKNSDCEGSWRERNWRLSSKVRVSNRIRYPGSPHSKRWMPAVGTWYQRLSESIKHPTWGVRRQRWNSKELTGARTSGGTCGLIRWYARNLTRAWIAEEGFRDNDALRGLCEGAAWLSSARALRCSVKSVNERNPCP